MAHEFVEFVPNELAERTLYISLPYATVVHLCFCGCGHEVVTPLSPTDWQLTFDGESISLHPSVGSWTLECQSHYWVRRGRVEWAPKMSDAAIREGRRRATATRVAYQRTQESPTDFEMGGFVRRVWRYLRSWIR